MAGTAKDKKEAKSIEDAFEKLDATIDLMSDENITLDESLKLYDKGIRLLRFCEEELKNAEEKITMLKGGEE